MCIVFATSTDTYSLIVASNRDEFLARPTTSAAWHGWDPRALSAEPSERSRVLSGLDLTAGGTWFGISLSPGTASTNEQRRTLHFATLTNFTETIPPAPRPSRGNLARDFLDLAANASVTGKHEDALQGYLDKVEATKHDYAGFNLLIGEITFPSTSASSASSAAQPRTRLGYISNREHGDKRARVLNDLGTSGKVRGLSNATLEVEEGEEEWPKVKSGAAAVEDAVRQAEEASNGAEEQLVEGLYEALSTSHPSPITHRMHLRHTVLVRPLSFDPSAPLPPLPPPFPPAPSPVSSSSTSAASSDPSVLPESVTAGPRESADPQSGTHWYGTRVQTLLLVERATGRVVLRERDAYVLDSEKGTPRWSGEERCFEVRL
ncbi:hypothetical protein Rhopal_007596-T1 [Rhodotorula paludigena]|uniref:NRDE protein-domain-containing protein n=1 Tax=Rhodotorula paludigena TaxID=86838 RepID=A0AAV5GW53_9BASI|nr:hypothetical protein Rhopal_007596-T1 [Rhodotorula paludigena]